MILPAVIQEKALETGEKDAEGYLNKVFQLLAAMEAGQELQVEKITKEKSRVLFIECVKLYIGIDPLNCGIQFNGDFTKIIRYDVF